MLSGGSCEEKLAAMGLSDRGGQPDFLQAAWGPGGVHSVLSSLAHRSRVLGKAPGVPASSYKDLSLEIVIMGHADRLRFLPVICAALQHVKH